ncbi:MAG: acid phosphatase [Acidimicrobiales bacterium]|nr:acid phosphatase [Acidimicrobiales bacterium]
MRNRWMAVAVAMLLPVVVLGACSKSSKSSTTSSAASTDAPVNTAPSPNGSGASSTPPTTSRGPTPSAGAPCGRQAAPPTQYDHVVVMVEENRTWTGGSSPAIGMGFSADKMPFLHGLATRCAYFTDWKETNGAQSSLTQYIGMTSGVSNKATVDDCNPSDTCHSTDDNIFRQIRTHNGTPRTYVDGATQPCTEGTNKPKHIPALYYWGGNDRSHCKAEVRPFTELDVNQLPTLAFVVPDQCHDGHDCDDTQVDAFAKTTLTRILDGASYRAGRTLVVVVYDEDRPVPNVLVAPTARPGAITSPAGSHASLLKTIEQALGLPVLKQGEMPQAISLRAPAHL